LLSGAVTNALAGVKLIVAIVTSKATVAVEWKCLFIA
jgi:hypothetical protein